MIDDIIRHMVPSPNLPVPHNEAERVFSEDRAERIAALRVIYDIITRRNCHGLSVSC